MKNQNGISLIALIITIIVIIILAAIVIGGVFSTPDDAKFATFCQEYDRVQTAIHLKYYELYEDYATDMKLAVTPTHYNIYNEVATGTVFTTTSTRDDEDNWVEITNWDNLCEKPTTGGTGAKWFLRESDGKLVYQGYERGEGEVYLTPSVSKESRDLVDSEADIVAFDTSLALANS